MSTADNMRDSFIEKERRHRDSKVAEDDEDDDDSSDKTNDEGEEGMNQNSSFPVAASGGGDTGGAAPFEDDTLANAAAGVAYGPTFYPTDEDFLQRPTTALDRRLWQQVLDLHAAAQQPEPLHELAILAEQQNDLLGLPPMGKDHNSDAVDHSIGPAAMNHLANADLAQHAQTAVAAFPALNDRKRPANNNFNINHNNLQQHSHENVVRTSSVSPKKRRVTETQTWSSSRKQMNQATIARRDAFKHLREMEQEFSQIQQRLEQAKVDFEKANENLQTTTETHLNELLQEDTSWNATYRLLRNFYRKYGHTNIPRRPPTKEQLEEEPDMAKLGRFVGENRRDYRLPLDHSNRLEEYKVMALQRLEFDFDPLRTAWERQYEALKAFYEAHGHTRIPYRPSSDYSDDEEDDDDEEEWRSLGSWIKRQRYQYKLYQEGNPASDMTPERIGLLNKINFQWQIRGTSSWEDYYEELKDYYNQHSNTLVPCSQKALYEWTNEQRQQCRLYEEDPALSQLNEEQYRQLKQLGLAWDLREGKWSRRFQELLAFQRQHGHCIVPTHYPYNQALVNWCATQRAQYKKVTQGKKSQLTPERVQMLESAGFDWEITAQQRANSKLNKTWDELYAELAHHQEHFGTLDGLTKDSELYHFCEEQRRHYEASLLTQRQQEMLDRLGFSWDVSESSLQHHNQAQASWESLYAELMVYRLNHGSFNVPTKYKELHSFIKEQRREYAKFKEGLPSQLNSERIRKLNDVKFPWKVPRTSNTKSWEENFGELLSYRLQNNTFDVSREQDEKLFRWVEEQKGIYQKLQGGPSDSNKTDTLLRKRLEKLEEINFPFT